MDPVNPIQVRIDGKRLLAVLKAHGGVYSAAKKARLSPACVYLWIEGKRTPRLQEWCQLLGALGEELPFCVVEVLGT